jgi:hypothetical protein
MSQHKNRRKKIPEKDLNKKVWFLTLFFNFLTTASNKNILPRRKKIVLTEFIRPKGLNDFCWDDDNDYSPKLNTKI